MANRRSGAAAHPRHERMSAVDTAWLRMDAPGNPMTIVSVLTTDTPVPADDLRRVVATRLLCFPRFRRRPVADALGASWHEHPGIDLDQHLVVTRLPRPGRQAQLQRLAARLAGEPLDPRRPLWQIHFVERFAGGSACVLRVHHCYADGMALLRVLLSMTGPEPEPSLATEVRRRTAPPRPRAVVEWLAAGQGGAVLAEIARVLALPDDPPTPLRSAPRGIKRVAWAAPLDLGEVRVLARALHCSVNDVLLATIAGALGAHLRETHGIETDGLDLRASVPVTLRTADEALALGNRFGLAFVDLPVGTRDPLARVIRLHETLSGLKQSAQPATTLLALGLMGLAPATLQAAAVGVLSRKATLVASNVAGPQAPLHLCGQRIRELYFWVPQSGSIGLGVSMLSYAGQVFIGCIAERDVLADPTTLVARFGPEFERLLLATTVGVLSGRKGRQTDRRG